VARIKLAYLGGGSTRAPGTMASFVQQGKRFNGSEVVLIDLNPEKLELVRRIAQQMAKHASLDITVTATTDRRAGLEDCDALLPSFRPGGFEARALDERIPVKHGVIGQETQGPGGFFMALRSIAVMQQVAEDVAAVCPNVKIFNYTNPVNIVAQALTIYTDIPTVSLCEGPWIFPAYVAKAAGLDPAKVHALMAGINHNCWSTEHTYDGEDLIPHLRAGLEARANDPALDDDARRVLRLAVAMECVPSYYFKYYYFRDEILRRQQGEPRCRAEVILAQVPRYWQHYSEQALSEAPALDPSCSRGGIHELELAIDAMAAHFNDELAVLPVNLPNRGGALPGFDEELVVEVPATVTGSGFAPIRQPQLPHKIAGLVHALAEHQILAAHAAWEGTAADGVRALAAHPLVPSLPVAEELYTEMAYAHAQYLPKRLIP
jgi:6-phospho-beta-glucosidase